MQLVLSTGSTPAYPSGKRAVYLGIAVLAIAAQHRQGMDGVKVRSLLNSSARNLW
jgi:hypothetical protein